MQRPGLTRTPSEDTGAIRRKLKAVARALEKSYGDRAEFRNEPRDPLDQLVKTLLSQNTTAVNTRRAYEAMRRAFPTWRAVLEAPPEALESALRPAGLARTRSARIQALLRQIERDHGDLSLDHLARLTTPEVERELLRFEGVGPKTAKCVALFALDRDVFPIDTHIHRVLARLGVIPPGMSRDAAHEFIEPLVPPGTHLALHLNLVAHGRAVCHPARPACHACVLLPLCDYGQSNLRKDSAS